MPSIGAKEIPEEKLEEGRREGRIQRLVRLLELRFQTVVEAVRARGATASDPEFDRVFERLLDDRRPDEVVAGR